MTDDPRWYAVVTRPRAEAQADRNLRRAGFWTFLPSERFKQRVGVKKELVDRSRPMLPRYLFVALRGRQALGTVRDTIGVSDLVRFGGDPVEIPHGVLNALMARVDADGDRARWRLRCGYLATTSGSADSSLEWRTTRQVVSMTSFRRVEQPGSSRGS
jgi:transcription antitermination factor NusG